MQSPSGNGVILWRPWTRATLGCKHSGQSPWGDSEINRRETRCSGEELASILCCVLPSHKIVLPLGALEEEEHPWRAPSMAVYDNPLHARWDLLSLEQDLKPLAVTVSITHDQIQVQHLHHWSSLCRSCEGLAIPVDRCLPPALHPA